MKKTMNIAGRFLASGLVMLWAYAPLRAANTIGLKLEGTWLITVNANSPAPGVPPFSFKGLNTFLSNGGLIVADGESAAPQGPPTAQEQVTVASAPGLGEWILVGDHLFVATSYQFRFDQNRQFVGMLRIRQTITLASTLDQFSATFTADLMDANGSVTGSIAGTAKAVRMDVLGPNPQ